MMQEEKSPQTGEEKSRFDLKNQFPVILIWARYLMPLITGVTLIVMSILYTVQGAMLGRRYEVSLLRLYANTFGGTHDYLGTEGTSAGNALYSALSIGAILGTLFFLVALFLAGLTAYTACRAFLAGEGSEENTRMKKLFKVAFPNRLCLFLSGVLFIVPALFPQYYSYISSRYVLVGGESVFYVMLNRPLIAMIALNVITLILALLIPKYERSKRMNMFAVHLPQAQADENEENEN